MSPELFFLTLLNGLAFGMLLFLMAAGLSLIFGMMDVLNLAHGSFYMIGGYIGLTVIGETHNFLLGALAAALAMGLLGLAIEQGLLKHLLGRGHLDQVLLTLGLVFIFGDVVQGIWGAYVQSIPAPELLDFSVVLPVIGRRYPVYRLFVILLGAGLGAALWYFLERTRLGSIIRAGVADRQMVEALGINVRLVFAFVFVLGAALAGLAGVISGPILGLFPGVDGTILILTLIVVVVGGMGTLRGAFWGALLVGVADSLGTVVFPEFAVALTFVIMAVVLLWRPSGLFGRVTA